jgi:hypothetical protein
MREGDEVAVDSWPVMTKEQVATVNDDLRANM